MPDIWAQLGALVKQYNALDLGRGNPDFLPKPEVRDALVAVATSEDPKLHQYTGGNGHPRLLSAIAAMYSPLFGRELDPKTEVYESLGGGNALVDAFAAMFKPGDEVIVIEPFFFRYVQWVEKSGATAVLVQLRPAKRNSEGYSLSQEWKLDLDDLEKAFTSKTRGIVFNNPHNPVGKVFTREELEPIAALCKKHDVIVIADEVYEFLVYDQQKFTRFATLPDMYERTVTVCSGGKIFSVTGWRVGWTIAPPNLTSLIQAKNTAVNPTVTQEAMARLLELETTRLNEDSCSFTLQSQEFSRKRDQFLRMLIKAGLKPIKPMGGYFIMADISHIDFPFVDSPEAPPRSYQFVTWMIKTKGLSAAPTMIYFTKENVHKSDGLIRFCFIKSENTLQKTSELLDKWIV